HKMQAGTKGDKSRSSLRIGERHTSCIGRRKAEIAKAILPIDFCSHRRPRARAPLQSCFYQLFRLFLISKRRVKNGDAPVCGKSEFAVRIFSDNLWYD
ncbi:MAG: hypothetical protein IKC14_00355, partial [Kiritimatiellae bacterium]|nr:hypothetical protein [Kiritimatiellia bacterium]